MVASLEVNVIYETELQRIAQTKVKITPFNVSLKTCVYICRVTNKGIKLYIKSSSMYFWRFYDPVLAFVSFLYLSFRMDN